MFSELGRVIETLGKERGIEKDIVIKAVEQAFLVTARKKYGIQGEYETRYNDSDDDIEIYQYKNVVEEVRDTIVEITLAEAKAEQEDLPEEDFYSKEPLKRAVQLTKRYRDIFFDDSAKHRTSSIVLTTIFGQFYEGEPSIYETIDNVLNRIISNYSDYQLLFENRGIYKRIKVLNPVNPEEDFSDKWDKDKEFYNQFIAFAKSYKEKWERLKKGDFGVAEELFGSTRTKTILKAQLENLSKGKVDTLEKAGLSMMAGNNYVDPKGNSTTDNGDQRKPHRKDGG